MALSTVQELVPDDAYLYNAPFLVVNHKVKDVGLVGWKNNRWSHQDKTQHTTAAASHESVGYHAPLPAQHSAWKQAFDPASCMYYFYNTSAGTTSWEAPSDNFTPDETVNFYLQQGIATPWVQPDRPHTTFRFPASSIADEGTLHGCSTRTHGGELDLIPANVRFSPDKKGDLARDVERYWVLRYSLFSRWSMGVVLDEKSLFAVTPEVIAKHHARMLCGASAVLDAFCGCGGNTIHLASCFETVIACEIDQDQLAMAKRNCQVYGVTHGVTWIHGDVFTSHIEPVDVVFLSPPWGGPGADGHAVFDATMQVDSLGRSIKDCIELACECLNQDSLALTQTNADTPNVAVYLPRNTSIASLEKCLAIPGFQVTALCLERNLLNEKLKSVSLYLRISSL
eukprot:jgi/Ulvmu1/1426/UM011_0155.1